MTDGLFSNSSSNASSNTRSNAMSDAIETLTARLSDALASVLPAGADWQSRLAPVVEATLGRLELVPREDFDRQRQQLERLMRDVARLEARISALEPTAPH